MLKPTPERIKKALSNPRLFRAWIHHLFGKATHMTYSSVALSLLSRYPIGTNIYEEDWDLLIILDACRVDAMREVASEYDFIEDVETRISLGSKTSEWLSQTFTEEYEEEISNTTYISANPWTERVFADGDRPEDHSNVPVTWTQWDTVTESCFNEIVPAWKYESTGEFGVKGTSPPPRYITDRAIETGRENNSNKHIVHYIQPHHRYTARAFRDNRSLIEFNEIEDNMPLYLRQGNDKSEVWPYYIDDLRYVLDSIQLLINNFDAEKVVITADHGEAFGEYGVIGHPTAVYIPQLRRVPWVELSASDQGEYEPVTEATHDQHQTDIESRLSDLGYR